MVTVKLSEGASVVLVGLSVVWWRTSVGFLHVGVVQDCPVWTGFKAFDSPKKARQKVRRHFRLGEHDKTEHWGKMARPTPAELSREGRRRGIQPPGCSPGLVGPASALFLGSAFPGSGLAACWLLWSP